MKKQQKYVIGINKESGVWFYVGTKDHEGKDLIPVHRYSSVVDDAMIYDSHEEAERIANSKIPQEYVRWVLAVYDCPYCKRKFVGYPALSRKDNKTEICPDCGVKEAMEALYRSRKNLSD